MRRDGGLLFIVFLLVLMSLVIGVALSWGKWQAYLIPVISAGLIFVLGSVQLILDLTAKRERQPVEALEGIKSNGQPSIFNALGPSFGWILSFSLGIYLLGFIIAIPLCTLIYLRSRGRNWVNSALVALLVGGIIFGMFEIGFDYYLYRGLIWESIFGM